jgi:hypothetical protein
MGEKLTIEQLRHEPCFNNLTGPMQKLVETFLQTGNKFAAVKLAYKPKSDKNARVMVYSLFSNPRIVAVLAIANGVDPEMKNFDIELQRAIRNPKTTRNQVTALRLFAQLHGFIPSSIPPYESAANSDSNPQMFAIGSVIVQGGKKYRVLAEEIQ